MIGHALWFVVTLALAASLVYCALTERPDPGCTADRPIMAKDYTCVAPEFFDDAD